MSEAQFKASLSLSTEATDIEDQDNMMKTDNFLYFF